MSETCIRISDQIVEVDGAKYYKKRVRVLPREIIIRQTSIGDNGDAYDVIIDGYRHGNRYVTKDFNRDIARHNGGAANIACDVIYALTGVTVPFDSIWVLYGRQ